MEKRESSIEARCIFYEDGNCYFVQSSPGKCSFCFNFTTTERGVSKGRVKPLYSMFDYLRGQDESELIFPEGNYLQETL
jgi:hypothetical protein